MSYTYAHRNKRENERRCAEPFSGGKVSSLPNSAMVENPGHQVDMPVVMREKMEGAFGMDLSAVKLYENKAVGKAGAEAVAQGSKIAFAPGKLDFSSIRGQALLGHEISHVASQARGEVKGSGLVNDSALESRADREGLMAARGESVAVPYGGASAPLSSASAASAAGPMQAKSGKTAEEKAEEKKKKNADRLYRIQAAMMREGAADAPRNPLLKKGDLEWYKKMQQNSDPEIFEEIQKRTFQSATNLVNLRDWMEDPELEYGTVGKENKELHGKDKSAMKRSKKNYNASYSNEGLDYEIYKSLMNSMKLPMNTNDDPEHIDPVYKEADRIQSARNEYDENGNANPEASYIREYRRRGTDPDIIKMNNANTRFDDMRKEARLNRFDEIAGGGKKKKMSMKDKKIQKDLDAMFAIYAGHLAQSDDGIYQEDRRWFENKVNGRAPKKEYFKPLMERIYNAKIKLGKNWEKAGGRNLSQKESLELTQKDDALSEYRIYNFLLQEAVLNKIDSAEELRNMMTDYQAQLPSNTIAAAEKGNTAMTYSDDFLHTKEGKRIHDEIEDNYNKQRYEEIYKNWGKKNWLFGVL